MLQRQRMLKLEQLLADIVQTVLQKGIRFGSIQLVDRTHSTADVNPAKESQNHCWLEETGIQSVICLHGCRTKKKDANKEVWLKLKASPAYGQGLDERYKIERKFGESKRQHGLGRCRYRGLERYEIQALLTAMALNLKRMVKLLYGVNLRNPSPVMA